MEQKNPPGFQSLTLLELPLVLLVEKTSRIKSAEELWQRDRIDESLICLPPAESLSRNFLNQLNQLGVDWFPSIEASSTDLIEIYVSKGLGIGLSVAIPKKPLPAERARVAVAGVRPDQDRRAVARARDAIVAGLHRGIEVTGKRTGLSRARQVPRHLPP